MSAADVSLRWRGICSPGSVVCGALFATDRRFESGHATQLALLYRSRVETSKSLPAGQRAFDLALAARPSACSCNIFVHSEKIMDEERSGL